MANNSMNAKIDTEPNCKNDSLDSFESSVAAEGSSSKPRKAISPQEAVRVFVRVRPLSSKEDDQKVIVSTKGSNEIIVKSSNCVFPENISLKDASNVPPKVLRVKGTYDAVFGPEASQLTVYDSIAPLIEDVAHGYNCTVFAYGQTGTGKTFTMYGNNLESKNDNKSSITIVDDETISKEKATPATPPSMQHHGIVHENWGLIPRAVSSLFKSLSKHAGTSLPRVTCSIMQIYNDKLYDSLNDAKLSKPLRIREFSTSSNSNNSNTTNANTNTNIAEVFVQGLSSYTVANLEDVLVLLQMSNASRVVRETDLNAQSSRSHSILQLSVEIEIREDQNRTIIRKAKLTLGDLAGSEKWAKHGTVMSNTRSGELRKINTSLSALGNCISALTEPNRKHIPYRNSILTRLLQDSLGGNTRTTLVATISGNESSMDETLNTLQFADRCKKVTFCLRANEVVNDATLLSQARQEIRKLKLMLLHSTTKHQEDCTLSNNTTSNNAQLIHNNKVDSVSSPPNKQNNPSSNITENKLQRRSIKNTVMTGVGDSGESTSGSPVLGRNKRRATSAVTTTILHIPMELHEEQMSKQSIEIKKLNEKLTKLRVDRQIQRERHDELQLSVENERKYKLSVEEKLKHSVDQTTRMRSENAELRSELKSFDLSMKAELAETKEMNLKMEKQLQKVREEYDVKSLQHKKDESIRCKTLESDIAVLKFELTSLRNREKDYKILLSQYNNNNNDNNNNSNDNSNDNNNNNNKNDNNNSSNSSSSNRASASSDTEYQSTSSTSNGIIISTTSSSKLTNGGIILSDISNHNNSSNSYNSKHSDSSNNINTINHINPTNHINTIETDGGTKYSNRTSEDSNTNTRNTPLSSISLVDSHTNTISKKGELSTITNNNVPSNYSSPARISSTIPFNTSTTSTSTTSSPAHSMIISPSTSEQTAHSTTAIMVPHNTNIIPLQGSPTLYKDHKSNSYHSSRNEMNRFNFNNTTASLSSLSPTSNSLLSNNRFNNTISKTNKNNRDVSLLASQTSVSQEVARKVLFENNGDLVNAIMALSKLKRAKRERENNFGTSSSSSNNTSSYMNKYSMSNSFSPSSGNYLAGGTGLRQISDTSSYNTMKFNDVGKMSWDDAKQSLFSSINISSSSPLHDNNNNNNNNNSNNNSSPLYSFESTKNTSSEIDSLMKRMSSLQAHADTMIHSKSDTTSLPYIDTSSSTRSSNNASQYTTNNNNVYHGQQSPSLSTYDSNGVVTTNKDNHNTSNHTVTSTTSIDSDERDMMKELNQLNSKAASILDSPTYSARSGGNGGFPSPYGGSFPTKKNVISSLPNVDSSNNTKTSASRNRRDTDIDSQMKHLYSTASNRIIDDKRKKKVIASSSTRRYQAHHSSTTKKMISPIKSPYHDNNNNTNHINHTGSGVDPRGSRKKKLKRNKVGSGSNNNNNTYNRISSYEETSKVNSIKPKQHRHYSKTTTYNHSTKRKYGGASTIKKRTTNVNNKITHSYHSNTRDMDVMLNGSIY